MSPPQSGIGKRPGMGRFMSRLKSAFRAGSPLRVVLLVLIVLGSTAGFIRWKRLKDGRYFWQPKPVPAVVAPEAPAPSVAAPAL